MNSQAVYDVLRTIDDPEMPISIVELGIVENVACEAGGADVHVDILPTFVGCPALPMIREEIQRKVGALEGVARVNVRFINDPPWTVDRISPAGRAALAAHGVTVPDAQADPSPERERAGASAAAPVVPLTVSAPRQLPCPFCGSTDTRMESPFGPTRCRMIYYCDACRNSFEPMKRI